MEYHLSKLKQDTEIMYEWNNIFIEYWIEYVDICNTTL